MTMNSISGKLKVNQINRSHGVVDTLTEVLNRAELVMSNYRTNKKYLTTSRECTLDIVKNKLKFSKALLKEIIEKHNKSIGIDRGNIMMAIHDSNFYTSNYYTIDIVESVNDEIRIEEKDLGITISFLINLEDEVYDVGITTLQ